MHHTPDCDLNHYFLALSANVPGHLRFAMKYSQNFKSLGRPKGMTCKLHRLRRPRGQERKFDSSAWQSAEWEHTPKETIATPECNLSS